MKRVCKACGNPHVRKNFYVHKKSGLDSVCKPCRKAQAVAWGKANPERRKKTTAKYRDANRTELRASGRRRVQHLRATDPERLRKASREYMSRLDPDKKRADLRRFFQTEKGRLLALEHQARRRARLAHGTLPAHIPVEVMQRVFEACGWRCAYCGSDHRLEFDHFEPLARGGEHSPGNLVLACKTCNLRKLNRDPFEWMERCGIDGDAVVAAICAAA